jgi:hypothetical protein
MKFVKKKKSVGVAFPHQKTKERSPDMTGQIEIQFEDLKELTRQTKGDDSVIVNVALWFYPADPDQGKSAYVSVQLTPPYRPRPIVSDDDPETKFEKFFEDVRRDNQA